MFSYNILIMSFNRRSNRVAGPGFYVNVRYDDIHVNYSKNMHGGDLVPPILNQGIREAELFDIKEQEILVCRRTDGSYSAAYGDGYTHCFSAANGFRLGSGMKGETDKKKIEDAILSKVQFVGIANTEYVPTKGYEQQGFVAQVGGVTTLLNESSEPIYPGDKVMLALDLNYGRKVTRDKGIPRQKLRFCLKRAMSDADMIRAAMDEVGCKGNKCQGEKDEVDKKRAEYEKNKTKKNSEELIKAQDAYAKALIDNPATSGDAPMMKKILDKYKELNERVIGKSYSYAKPGDRLEVGLQPRNAF